MGDYLSPIKRTSAYNGKIVDTTISLTNYYLTLTDTYYLASTEFDGPSYILKDGATIYSRTYNTTGYFTMWVDVNGYKKKPNTLGKDLFGIVASNTKFAPMGATGTGVENTCNSNIIACPYNYGFTWTQSLSFAGAGCSAEYLYK